MFLDLSSLRAIGCSCEKMEETQGASKTEPLPLEAVNVTEQVKSVCVCARDLTNPWQQLKQYSCGCCTVQLNTSRLVPRHFQHQF